MACFGSMDAAEADRVLEQQELVPCVEGALAGARQTLEACLAADIPARLGRDHECQHEGGCKCDSGGCGGGCNSKVQVLVRREDVTRVMGLLRSEWLEAVRREGVEFAMPVAPTENGEAPCPACGTAAPLVEGACSDCGLVLE